MDQLSEPKKTKKKVKTTGSKAKQEPREPQDITVPVNLQFLVVVRNVLTSITPRVNFEPHELLPSGMILRDLNIIIEKNTPKSTSAPQTTKTS
jgi:hypothetical protein